MKAGKEGSAQERDRWKLTSAAVSSIAIACSCIIQGPVFEIFAKREGWYEYECKVSVIEGEDATSMGIETKSRADHKQV
jgi:hypothetical protein